MHDYCLLLSFPDEWVSVVTSARGKQTALAIPVIGREGVLDYWMQVYFFMDVLRKVMVHFVLLILKA